MIFKVYLIAKTPATDSKVRMHSNVVRRNHIPVKSCVHTKVREEHFLWDFSNKANHLS